MHAYERPEAIEQINVLCAPGEKLKDGVFRFFFLSLELKGSLTSKTPNKSEKTYITEASDDDKKKEENNTASDDLSARVHRIRVPKFPSLTHKQRR